MTAFRFSLLTLALVALAACQSPADAPAPAAADTPVAPTALTSEAPTPDPDAPLVTVYKSPTCGCCSLWGEHLEAEGFRVEARDVTNMTAIKDSLGVPRDLASCHTGVVEGYFVEGHVPAENIRQLLADKPEARGLTVPGMPIGSPGMEVGDRVDAYDILIVDDSGEAAVFASVEGNQG
ncbi:MAG TPA: DUF411 domain-containing protein [Bacteroidetes bacterium]|nr:DUF411 domain-containing protein [Bacteroidota bacterium]HIL56921.1 DUF411 domain-containing protein [Rhodothermales bacterium]